MARTHERRSYEQFCPISRALDVLGERWTLLIVRELLMGPLRYTDLREHLPGMWSNLLAQRLRDLEAGGIVRRTELPPPAARTVYELTERGRLLAPVLHEIARWGLPYLDAPSAEQPILHHMMPEGVRSMILIEALPSRPVTAHLVFEPEVGEFSVDVAAEGAPLVERVRVTRGAPARADVVVRGSILELLGVRRGDVDLADTGLTLEGPPRKVDAIAELFGLTASATTLR